MLLWRDELAAYILPPVTIDELREEIRTRVDRRWRKRTEFARQAGIDYKNFNNFLNAAPRPGGGSRSISAENLLKIAPVIGLTISFESSADASENAQRSVTERPMQHAESSQPERRPHAAALSSEDLSWIIADALAPKITRAVEELGKQLERTVERVATLERQRPKTAPQAPPARRRRRG